MLARLSSIEADVVVVFAEPKRYRQQIERFAQDVFRHEQLHIHILKRRLTSAPCLQIAIATVHALAITHDHGAAWCRQRFISIN